MDQAIENRIKTILIREFQLDEEDITDELSPESVALWDSLNHLSMITALEKTFQLKLSMKEIRSMVTFRKIQEVVKDHLTGKDQ